MPYFVRLYTSPTGRTGRLGYNLFFVAPCILLGVVAGYFSPASLSSAQLLLLVIVGVTLWPSVVMNIKRLHDIGLPGWPIIAWWVVVFTAVLLRVPYVAFCGQLLSLLIGLLLMLIPGTKGPNRYGAKP